MKTFIIRDGQESLTIKASSAKAAKDIYQRFVKTRLVTDSKNELNIKDSLTNVIIAKNSEKYFVYDTQANKVISSYPREESEE